jgi:hypothetical protein
LKNCSRIKVIKKYDGIYEIENEIFPVRIIVSKRLSGDENIWLKNFNDKLKLEQVMELENSRGIIDQSINMAAYWDVLINANMDIVKEVNRMSGRPLDDYVKERGLDKIWGARGEERGEERTIYIIKCLKNQVSIEQISNETKIPVDKIKKIKSEIF